MEDITINGINYINYSAPSVNKFSNFDDALTRTQIQRMWLVLASNPKSHDEYLSRLAETSYISSKADTGCEYSGLVELSSRHKLKNIPDNQIARIENE
jgi:hypothetical protein